MPTEISNQSIAELIREIGEYLAMQDVPFKPRAYAKAAVTLDGLEDDLVVAYKARGIKALLEIPGVGASIAATIEEFIKTGRVKYFEELKKETPVRLDELARIEGLGPKSVKKLYETLGVKNLADLEKAAKAGKIAKLEGFGKKSEEKILKGIGFAAESGKRFVLGYELARIERIRKRLEEVPGAGKVTVAGSARRKRDTIGDVDILAVAAVEKDAKKSAPLMEKFVGMPEVINIIAQGDTKSSVKLKGGMNVDLRVVPKESYGAALNYFTGSKDHNVALRKIAISKGLKLNEYGLFKATAEKGREIGKEKMVAGASEEDIYAALGMEYIEPELRENTGEIEAAIRQKNGTQQGKKPGLPKLIGYGDLQGDLQIQTNWTDGAESIEAMARKAIKHGLKYIVITDHTKRLAMTGGLDEKRIVKQWAEIDKVNKKLDAELGRGKFRILKGSECDILKDGSLDLPDEILAQLDVVGVSVHSYFGLPRAEQTARVRRAIENPNADILFHPTGRILNKRAAIDIDIDEIIAVAKKTGTVMEINSFPERSDLKDEHIRKCIEAGVKLSIDSDAHNSTHYANLAYGISQARRGWVTRADVINAWPVEKMLGFLKGVR